VSGLLDRLTLRLGALPARRVTWFLVALFSIWVLVDVLVVQVTGGMARSSFDAMVRARIVTAAPDPRIVIVDIDEASLARMGKEFGRWPWPRDTLATVLDHVEKQQPAAIVWDIIFSDADRLSPGGDAAFNAAVARSKYSHFSVVRLPPANDAVSQLTRKELPGLWSRPATAASPTPTIALIAPVLPAVAAARLGFNNGYPDGDGVLRRYRHHETLADGSQIQSMAASLASRLNPAGQGKLGDSDALISWRKAPNAYPRISFADVFAQADGDRPLAAVPSFAGKVVLIGATASSLHDIHPTPLSPLQPGVESLATAIDNAINQRVLHELPRWLQAALAIALCVGIAIFAQFKSIAALAPALFVLPAALIGLGYISLNGAPVFLDLHLAAGLALLFLALLRFWDGCRQQYWRAPPATSADQPLALWSIKSQLPWFGTRLDRLIDTLEQDAPTVRLIFPDIGVAWPGKMRWPEHACQVSLVGPEADVLTAKAAVQAKLGDYLARTSVLTVLPATADRTHLAQASLASWAELQT
jgi:adenylate cyclase